MLALVNGGAAVAILAYLGNIAGHAPTAPQPDMIRPLAWFSTGLLAAAITFIVAYHTQLLLFQEESDRVTANPVVSDTFDTNMVSCLDLCCLSSRQSLSVLDV